MTLAYLLCMSMVSPELLQVVVIGQIDSSLTGIRCRPVAVAAAHGECNGECMSCVVARCLSHALCGPLLRSDTCRLVAPAMCMPPALGEARACVRVMAGHMLQTFVESLRIDLHSHIEV